MEEHRLVPMVEGYDEQLFNDLYKKTEQLRKKLAYEIDARRLGVDYREVLSWFDIKFIYVYNKYCNSKDPDVLKGHLINALQLFKYRVLRKAYSKKAEHIMNTDPIDSILDLEGSVSEDMEQLDTQSAMLQKALAFLKNKISLEAFNLLCITLNPPEYILEKVGYDPKLINRIPEDVMVDYLGYEGNEGRKHFKSLNREVKQGLALAREHFHM